MEKKLDLYKNIRKKDFLDISRETYDISKKIEDELKEKFSKIDSIKFYNQAKVLNAMKKAKLSDVHFSWTTGYGYNDISREKIEEIYRLVFSAQAALVRPNIVNGTHALSLCLNACLSTGDIMLAISGKPYDTLDKVIGIVDSDMSLKSYGVKYEQIELLSDGSFDQEKIVCRSKKNPKIKMAYIQRSKGYSDRNSLTIEQIKNIIDAIKSIDKNIIIMVDNCYGEFIESLEPTDIGADIMAGSLIKNPGGGLALTGGYICGREDLVEKCAKKLTANSIGGECGLTFGTTRLNLQGLFIAPAVTTNALKGAIFAAKLFESANFYVFPKPNDDRSDIIQGIRLESKENMLKFCEGVQQVCPVDSFVNPIPGYMPGYTEDVIMACGGFVQGSSIELSADGPVKPPYNIYFQGGMTYEHSKIGAMSAFEKIKHK